MPPGALSAGAHTEGGSSWGRRARAAPPDFTSVRDYADRVCCVGRAAGKREPVGQVPHSCSWPPDPQRWRIAASTPGHVNSGALLAAGRVCDRGGPPSKQ